MGSPRSNERWLLAAVLLGGCAGSGEGLDENGRPPGEAVSGELAPTIESIQDHVFTPHCVRCHQGNHVSGLELENAQQSYDELVDVASTEEPLTDRVEPGLPDDSYLIHKLEGTQSVGERMPLGGPYLDAETIGVIRQWISDGAPPPSTMAQSTFLSATHE